MADSNVIEEVVEVIDTVEDIPVTVIKTSNKGKIIFGVAVTGIVVGAAVGITKLMKKRKAVKAVEETVDNEIEINELEEAEED